MNTRSYSSKKRKLLSTSNNHCWSHQRDLEVDIPHWIFLFTSHQVSRPVNQDNVGRSFLFFLVGGGVLALCIYNIYIFIISISSNFKWDKNTEWNQIRVSSILFSVFTLEKLSLNHHCCQRIRKRFTASHHNLTEKSVWVAHLANKPLKYLFLGFKQYPPATWFPNFKALPLFSNQADPSPVRELRRSQGLHEVFATRIVTEGFRRRFRRTTPAMRRFFQRLHLLPFSLLFSSLCIRITTIFGSNTIVKHAIRFQYRLRTNFQAEGWKEFIWLSIDIIQLISWGKCCEHRHGWEFLQNKIPRFFLWLLHHCTCHPVMSRLMIWKDVIISWLSSISDDSA